MLFRSKLEKSMYGTRDAAQNWEEEYTEFLIENGFKQGIANPCLFFNFERGIRTVIHGDDLTNLGNENSLDWFRRRIEERFEVKFRARLGPDAKDDRSVRILNRVVEWTPTGIRYEADQRHADIIVKSMGVHVENQTATIPGRIEEEKIGRAHV